MTLNLMPGMRRFQVEPLFGFVDRGLRYGNDFRRADDKDRPVAAAGIRFSTRWVAQAPGKRLPAFVDDQTPSASQYGPVKDTGDDLLSLRLHRRDLSRCSAGETLSLERAGVESVRPPGQRWQVLGLTERASAADIDAAYRRLAREAHSDTGGSDAAMSRLNVARDAGRKAVS